MKKILVPTDFSAVADNAVTYAIHIAKWHNTEFVFFHAGKTTKDKLQENIMLSPNHSDLLQHKVHYISAETDFNAELVKQLIKEYAIDLVIMGTHGSHTPITPALFGSNTAAVLEDTSVPVIVIPPSYVHKDISKIAYASDLIKLKQELITLIPFAKAVNAAIEIVHVVPVYPDLYDAEKTDVNKVIEQIKQEQNFSYIKYIKEETKFDNQVVKGIDRYLESHTPDILALFHANRNWLDKILNPSATVREVTHIKIPLLVFPKFRSN